LRSWPSSSGSNREKGISVVVVTHEPDISLYAQRIITFKDGKIVKDEPVRTPRDAAQELREPVVPPAEVLV